MAQKATKQALKSENKTTQQQALQENAPPASQTVQNSGGYHFPQWPHSKPGPRSTPPPQGSKPINVIRREQVAELDSGQATGKLSTQSAVPASVNEMEKELALLQETLKKRRQRL
ncbi:MAG: hypothetical protein E6J34_18845 [Chloroflexi bacterium]|nr:MAG: hypothetical protein E6J34_18845 [Chloroflexota bacterium]